jgi:arabinose-5-phosphate isomerase
MAETFLERAKLTLQIEAKAVKDQIDHLDGNFVRAVEMVTACRGRIVVMGLGKSGLIGRKIAASMSSVGVPSVFVHPAECLHGDLGMIMAGDIVLVLSYTGETDEIKKVLPVIRNMNINVIVMTGRPGANVWKKADVIINTKIEKEACPYNLVPTASTTAMLALGDAMALSAAEKKGFKKEQLARFHPAGGLGKRLTVKVKDIMRGGNNNPVIREQHTVNEALLVMTRTRVGATSVVNKEGKLIGFFTDGDLRRKLQKDKLLLGRTIGEVMTRSPLTIDPDSLAADAAALLKKNNVDNVPVVNAQGKPVGILDERDLLAEGIA